MNKEITGAGGKGGGAGRPAVEAPNTLRSAATVRVVEVLSEGEIEGLCGGARGVYLNDTPLQAADNSYNFPRAAWDYRVGLPNQDYMKGFDSVEAEITVSLNVTTTTPAVKTTTSANVDAVKVTMQLPQGLFLQDTTNGDLKGTAVSFVIEKKLTASGSWLGATTFTIEGKTTSAYERQYRIDRPVGTGTWDVRVTRTTADSTLASLKNATQFARMTEVQEIKDETTEYNDTAVIGLSIDAESVGNSVPNRSYLVKGIKVQIPSNYNPITRVYTGTWNGTFQTAWTDNPAWVLYDLLTNERYGLGEFIAVSVIDKYSFYDAAVYNDAGIIYTSLGAYVSGGVSNGLGSYEPRFTFNAVIAERAEAYRLLQLVAGAMRGNIVYVNGLITLLQDRPSDPVKLLSKANVLEGGFTYKSTGLFERHTAFNVTFNDRTDRHLQKITTIDASSTTGAMQTALAAAQAKYGYNPTDVAAYGATTEGQAIRQGRWALDTELNQTELASWKMSLNGYDLLPGDVVKIYDEDYAAKVGAGRIVSVTGTSVTLDRAVQLSAGSFIEVMLADGQTLQTRNIVQTSGTLSTFTVSSVFSQSVLAGADYIVTTTVAPRQFKIIGVSQDDAATITLEAVYHDPNKYARVETGVVVPETPFSDAVSTVTSAPRTLLFKESSVTTDSTIKRSLMLSWSAPAVGAAAYYTIMWRCNNGTWATVPNYSSLSYELVNIPLGVYDVRVYANSAYGNQSAALTGSYTLNGSVGGTSTLGAPTTLVEQNAGAAAFLGVDLNFKWTNPASNADVVTSTLRDFEVKIIETAGSTTLRTYYVPAVTAGSVQSSTYTFAQNQADNNNVPIRAINVEVRCRDTNGNLSAAVQTTFTNAAPGVVTGVVMTGGMKVNKMVFTQPTDIDYKGVLVWGSTSPGFALGIPTLLFDGTSNNISFTALNDTQTYYYRIAVYDTFGKSYTGVGLNVSGEVSTTTTAGPGIPLVSSLPGSGTEGQVIFNTTDGQLYRYHSGAWTLAVPAVNVTGTLTDAQLASIAAAKLTGQITSTQITDNSISTAKLSAGAVTAAKIAADTITAAEIATGTITATEIATGAITTTKVAANAITSNELASNSVIAGKIAAGTISAGSGIIGNLAVDTLQIAGNAVTVAAAGEATPVDAPYLTEATMLDIGTMNTTVDGVSKPLYLHIGFDVEVEAATTGATTGTYRVKLGGTTVKTYTFGATGGVIKPFLKSEPIYIASPPTGAFSITVTHVMDRNSPGTPAVNAAVVLFALGTKR